WKLGNLVNPRTSSAIRCQRVRWRYFVVSVLQTKSATPAFLGSIETTLSAAYLPPERSLLGSSFLPGSAASAARKATTAGGPQLSFRIGSISFFSSLCCFRGQPPNLAFIF